jgi:hypothetical protein
MYDLEYLSRAAPFSYAGMPSKNEPPLGVATADIVSEANYRHLTALDC